MQAFVIFPISLIFTHIFVAELVSFYSALTKDRTAPVVLTIAQAQPSSISRLKFYCMHGVAVD